MDTHKHHAELINGFLKEQKELFDNSTQGIYVFLDDDCRVCNTKFAQLLGYSSSEEWFKVPVNDSFPAAFVDEASQQKLVESYLNAMEKLEGSTTHISWKKKNGETIDTTVILVPVVYKGHRLALHFVS